MDRTVPKTGSEEIELYMRTYYSLLRSTHTIQLETLAEAHMAMESSLHVKARSPLPDISAIIYTSLRLPACIVDVDYVILGQIEKSFLDAHYSVNEWEQVYAPVRRRRMHFDGEHTLAVFIASRSDIDDLIPMLTAYQIEWNKLHLLLQSPAARAFLSQNADVVEPLGESQREVLAAILQVDEEDLKRLEIVWGSRLLPILSKMAAHKKQIGLRQIAGSLADYRRATAYWWEDLNTYLRKHTDPPVDLDERPIYFISSNTHSLTNLMTGFALRVEPELIAYIEAREHEGLLREYREIEADGGATHKNNFLYYVLKKYLSDDVAARERYRDSEAALGIQRVPSRHGSDLETQVIEVNRLRTDWIDPRALIGINPEILAASDAVIVNVDYPLGLAAYELLTRLTERAAHLLGVYVMGKAATLNGRIGDVVICNVVHDEHSQNTYMFENCFSAQRVAPHLTYSMVLDNQKAISAPGTFLQNPRYMEVFYREGYTLIEMEAGPYLSAVYEAARPKRHPQNEIVNLYAAPFDVGFLHYASDTPFTKGHNLGAGNLSYTGIDATYASAVAILQRIFERETQRLMGTRQTYGNNGVVSPLA